MTGGLTVGMVDLLTLQGQQVEVYGAAVDRCSRIASFALPGQILIDLPLLEVIRAQLRDRPQIVLGQGHRRILKGVGDTELFEVSTVEAGLRQYVHTPFRVHDGGRLPIADKVYFVRDARNCVIEMGTGATTFARFFSGHRPSEFRDHIENLLAKGVRFTLLVMDPDWEHTDTFLGCRREKSYLNDIRGSLALLKSERERLLLKGVPGEFDIRLYRAFPEMHLLAVDPEDEMTGRMLASPYCYGLPRAESPVFEFSRLSNLTLFMKYWKGLISLMNERSVPLR